MTEQGELTITFERTELGKGVTLTDSMGNKLSIDLNKFHLSGVDEAGGDVTLECLHQEPVNGSLSVGSLNGLREHNSVTKVEGPFFDMHGLTSDNIGNGIEKTFEDSGIDLSDVYVAVEDFSPGVSLPYQTTPFDKLCKAGLMF